MQVRRIWSECKSALDPDKPVDFGGGATRRLVSSHTKKTEDDDADLSSDEECDPDMRHRYNPMVIATTASYAPGRIS